MAKSTKKDKKRKISIKKIITLIFVLTIALFIYNILTINITNIYISGNNYFKDQEIIDIAKLSNYPNSISNLSFNIEKRLEKNKYIYKSEVSKNIFLNEVYISIEENYPLFYYSIEDKTILYNGDVLDDEFSSITVINSIPNEIFDKLIHKLKNIDISILNRISEIEYKPKDNYNDRFLLLMNDGNYVTITLKNFKTLNKYVDIIKYISPDSKGIIKLDSGKYFDEFDK